MKRFYLAIVVGFLLLAACTPKVQQSAQPATEKTPDTVATAIETPEGAIDRIVFGRYCGKCRSRCATMYQLNMATATRTLYKDTTDSFRDNFGMPTCNTPVKDSKKLALANSLVAKIPAHLLTTDTLSETFGCPDCADGCGLYFQLVQGKKVKQFYIDTNTSELKPGIKDFAVALTAVIEQLNEGIGR